jgi:phosphoglucomutase/phosphomannomutase
MNNLKEPITFDLATQKNVDLWLKGHYDAETKSQIRQLLREDPKQIADAFYTNLTFGTGGLRGLIGLGTHRMNFYTVRAATQGLANYIQKQPKKQNQAHAVFIGYDSRHYSREFAEETAKVLAGNHIDVYLFEELRPTPLVSFGCRYKNCIAAIMITASHNPPAYNGYKVFWSDGGQIVPPHDKGIMHEVVKITDPTMVKMVASLSHPLIKEIGTEVDNAYIQSIKTLQNYPEVNHKEGHRLKIVYTSLHGTGITLVPKALHAWGFSTPAYVESQMIPDGAFPTVTSPNPEEPLALKMGIDRLLETESDLLIATDPDADRMGLAVRHQNQAVLLNGNQISALCLEHICAALSAQNRLPERAAFIKTIGTTELFQAICNAYQRPCFNVLTGFKYIAEKIYEWENHSNGYQYIFGGEESYGYLLGTFTRDKDAVSSSALISEVALHAKLEGKTLVDKLHDLYHKYGVYQEGLLSLNFGETKEGKEQMAVGMRLLRESKLDQINGIRIIAIEDYLKSTKFYLKSNKKESLHLPISDVLLYWLEDGSKVMIRPSGTEPKVKVYCGVFVKTFSSITEGIETCLKRCNNILHYFETQLLP